MRVLVTGATGKVGNAVALRAVERGDEVVALVRDADRARSRLPSGVELVRGDVTDVPSVHRAAAGVDGVFNCRGSSSNGCSILASSIASTLSAPPTSSRPRGRRAHALDLRRLPRRAGRHRARAQARGVPEGHAVRALQAAGRAAGARGAAHGIEVVIINPGGIYGPGPWAEAGFDAMFRDVVLGRLRVVEPGGAALALAEDVAAAHLAAFDRGLAGERYIAANGFATVREMCEGAVAAAGRGRVPRTIPAGVARALAGGGELLARLTRRPPLVASGDLQWLLWQARADASKAERELGVTFTPWPESVRRTVEWMLEESGQL